jgi:hypothetical protein
LFAFVLIFVSLPTFVNAGSKSYQLQQCTGSVVGWKTAVWEFQETDSKLKFAVQVSWNKSRSMKFCWPNTTKLQAEVVEISQGLIKLTLQQPSAYVHFAHNKQYDDVQPERVSVNVAMPSTAP